MSSKISGKALTVCALLFSLSFSHTIRGAAPSGYYSTCEGLGGQALLTALHNKITSHTNIGYDGLWNAYKTTDVDANGKIIDIYSTKRWTPGTDQCGSYSNVGDCYNREHSVPQSWFSEAVPMKADAFHIYPTDGKVNGQRSNYPFGECAKGTNLGTNNGVTALGKLGASTFSGYSGTVFEPDDEYKGDLARSYFYMATCYNDKISNWSGGIFVNAYPCFPEWVVNLLLKWHRQDPVSDKELKRQEAIYKLQNNRNPYIDHPELAEYVWGDKKTEKWSSATVVDAAFAQPVSGTTVDCGTIKTGTTSTTTITVYGTNFTSATTVSLENLEYSPETIFDTVVLPKPEDPEPEDPEPSVTTVTDKLTRSSLGIATSGSGYKDYTATINGRGYSINVYPNNNYIQIKKASPSGIVSTSGNGVVRKVTVSWNSSTSTDRSIEIFGKNTAYSGPSDLYNNNNKGTSLGTIKKGTSTELVIEGDYKYIGILASGALYLDEINIDWEIPSTPASAPRRAAATSSDELTSAVMGADSGSGYNLCTESTTGRAYNAYINKGVNYLQLNSKQKSAIYNTANTDGKKATAVSIVRNGNPSSTNTLLVYGKDTPYETYTDFYDNNNKGTQIGELDGNTTSVTLSGNYKYIGVVSKSGAIYLEKLTITWAGDDNGGGNGGGNDPDPEDPEEPGLSTDAFSTTTTTLTAAQVNNATAVTITFAPLKKGTYTGRLTLTNGSLTDVVELRGCAVDGLTALDATESTPTYFQANWVDLDNGEGNYTLHVCKDDVELDGYPVTVSSGERAYGVGDLTASTVYSYYLTCGEERSNTIYVATHSDQPEIVLATPNDSEEVHLRSNPKSHSEPATLLVFPYLIDSDMEVSVEVPFEISLDKQEWVHKMTLDRNIGQFYVRLNTPDEGTYFKQIFVNGHYDETLPANAPRRAESWNVTQTFNLYGEVSQSIPTGLDTTNLTPWEAIGLEGGILVENNCDNNITLDIYTLEGYQVAAINAPMGNTMHDIAPGFYLVVNGDNARRIFVK